MPAATANRRATLAVLADHHQPYRHRAWLVDWKGNGAAVEKVDDRGVAQDQAVEPKMIFID